LRQGPQDELRSQQAARLHELQLVADEVQASKSAMRTTADNVTRAVKLVALGQQWLPVWPGFTSPEAPLDGGRGCMTVAGAA
jgi:hypothetical protein